MEALLRKGISAYLRRIVSSYLSHRSLIVEGEERQVTAGVPQGSILGPLLWNLAYDGVLELDLPTGAQVVAYADDLALLVTARKEDALQEATNEALELINEWMTRNHLELAPHKTEALYLTGRKRTRGIDLMLAGHRIEIGTKAKYLGVMLDTGLNGKAHIAYVATKVQKVSLNLARLMPRVNGASGDKRRLLASVGQSIALYASPVWGSMALQGNRNRSSIRSAQRVLAIRVSRAYRTVSTEALLVLAKLLPWDLLIEERSKRYLATGEVDHAEASHATIDAWQAEWEREVRPGEVAKGTWTKSLIPDIRQWLDSAGEMSYYVAQVLTGHGQFQSYMLRIGKSDSDRCVLCDTGDADDVTHTVLRCPALCEARNTRVGSPGDTLPEIVKGMMADCEAWSEVSAWLNAIMLLKVQKEELRRRRLVRNERSISNETGREMEFSPGEGNVEEGRAIATTLHGVGSRRTPSVGTGITPDTGRE